ncbi:MAG: hypothetical protein HON53_20600 [Planctomycetaceae bacterium]|jgi:hypothetical protein|nr:hypothetical protein [Planctomycetaceae bacterium]MBT6156332.1 hypothetical protein [Planctomycetaceae bacterium]MBT6483896.1 hypothetical protein [Planctomycetaceae bacterium]MBT6496079.1 hypothetical protein [Planctomycetaceae bacterium]
MRVFTLIQYLCGNRQAIAEVVNCRHAVWLGLLFVFSAGFAREFDGEDLLHEPWHVALPLGASLLTSFLLYVLIRIAFSTAKQDEGEQDQAESNNFLSNYRKFLSVYWMTAPLAWLYAVPVERFLDAPDAVRVNLWLLGIVSVWRVALITRVVSVVYARSAVSAFFVVMLFADTVAMFVFWLTPLPILNFMGGIRLTESEQVIQATGFLVRFLGTVSLPVWLIGASVNAVRSRRKAAGTGDIHLPQRETQTVTWGLWGLSAFSILVWIAILPLTQGEQINRRRVEIDLRAGRIAEAVQYMSQRDRSDFPPHWSPPPRLGYGERKPSFVDVLLYLEASGPQWGQELYRKKLAVQTRAGRRYYRSHGIRLREMDDETLARYVKLLESLPEGPAMAHYHEREIQGRLDPEYYGDEPVVLSDNRRASLEAILSLVPEEEN